jgi:hypothetical protein
VQQSDSVALPARGKTALAVGQPATILRTANAGATWSTATSGTEAALLSVGLSVDGKTALGFDGTILRSADGGITWSPLPGPRRWPPRIVWLFWVVSILPLFRAFVALPPTKPPPRDIAELLATDRPLRKGDQDATGQADQLAPRSAVFCATLIPHRRSLSPSPGPGALGRAVCCRGCATI